MARIMSSRELVVRVLPPPAKAIGKRVYQVADPALRWVHSRKGKGSAPIPPAVIRGRSGNPTIGRYTERGALEAGDVRTALEEFGRPIEQISAVLDYGAGSGRVLHHLASAAPGARFYGSDVDAEAIAWARKHRPAIEWAHHGHEPPLPWPDGTFGLIYSISVFTHLPEHLQLEWLRELRRVLRPDGVAALSVHGPHAYNACRTGGFVSGSRGCARRINEHGPLEAERFVYEPYEVSAWTSRDFPGTGDSFGMTFHLHDYVRAEWAAVFDVREILPRRIGGWQDLVIATPA